MWNCEDDAGVMLGDKKSQDLVEWWRFRFEGDVGIMAVGLGIGFKKLVLKHAENVEVGQEECRH